jgi:hypothetical protein
MYSNTLGAVKHQIELTENPMPPMLCRVETAHVDNALYLDHFTSEEALEEPKVGSTVPNIQIDNNSTDDDLNFGRPGHSSNYPNAGNQINTSQAIPTASQ